MLWVYKKKKANSILDPKKLSEPPLGVHKPFKKISVFKTEEQIQKFLQRWALGEKRKNHCTSHKHKESIISLTGYYQWVIWRTKNHSLLTVWPLVGSPCSNGCTHTHTHMSNTHWTQWANRTKNKRIWMKLRQFGWFRDGWLRRWFTVYIQFPRLKKH